MYIDYQKTLRSSQMIIYENIDPEGTHHALTMLTRASIPGLLPMWTDELDGSSRYIYDITSRHSFIKLSETVKPDFNILRLFLTSLKSLYITLEEYILEPDDIVLEPEALYLNLEKTELYFCLLPGYKQDLSQQLKAMSNYFITCIDYSDKNAVSLCFELNALLQSEALSLEAIDRLLQGTDAKETPDTHGFKTLPSDSHPEDDMPTKANADISPQGKPQEKETQTEHQDGDKKLSFWEKARIYFEGKSFPQVLNDFNSWQLIKKIKDTERPYTAPASSYTFRETPLYSIPVPDSSHGSDSSPRTVSSPGTAPSPGLFPDKHHTVPDTVNASSVKAEPAHNNWETELLISENAEDYDGSEPTELLVSDDIPVSGFFLINESVDDPEPSKIVIGNFPFTIGKSAEYSDMVLSNPIVSRIHARLYRDSEEPDIIYFEDLNSKNGSFINGVCAAAYTKTTLKDGDVISIATEKYRFVHI